MICFIKAIIPLFNYDGEPSVSNGIAYQLPSSHLFIHRVTAKLSNRVMPYGVNYCRLQLLFIFSFTDPLFTARELNFQWTLSLVSFLGLVEDAVLFAHHPIFGFLIQNPARFQIHSTTRQGSGISDTVLYLCCLNFLLIRSYYISQHLLRIVSCPFCQDAIDYPQYLTGNHNQ